MHSCRPKARFQKLPVTGYPETSVLSGIQKSHLPSTCSVLPGGMPLASSLFAILSNKGWNLGEWELVL